MDVFVGGFHVWVRFDSGGVFHSHRCPCMAPMKVSVGVDYGFADATAGTWLDAKTGLVLPKGRA